MNNSCRPKTENIPMELLYPLMEDMLAQNGSVTFTVTGVSMQPMLYNRRDTVTIVSAPDKLKVNDLPFYRMDDGKFILHRVRKVHSDGTYECRGDNRWESEDNIRNDQIIGIVTNFTRNGKQYTVKNPIYKIYVLLWPALHYLKKYYKYFADFKRRLKNIKEYILYLAKPIKIRAELGDNIVKDIKFRKAVSSDIPNIQKLCGKLIEFEEEKFNADSANKFWFLGEEGKKFFSKWIDTRFLWVAVCGGETVGYIRGYISKDLSLKEPVGYLQNIYIEPEYRGAGVGSEFVKLFKQYCQDNNCFRISVSFMEDNLNAERFYQSKGFEKSTKTYKCKI